MVSATDHKNWVWIRILLTERYYRELCHRWISFVGTDNSIFWEGRRAIQLFLHTTAVSLPNKHCVALGLLTVSSVKNSEKS